MHRLVERQLKRHLGDVDLQSISPAWQAFLNAVSETYVHTDEDREQASRSLDISSQEFTKLNETVEKEKQAAEKKAEEVNAIVTSVGEGLIALDGELKVVLANEPAGKLFGLPLDRIIGQPMQALARMLHGNQEIEPDRYPEAIALKTKQTVVLDLTEDRSYHASSGRIFSVAVTATPLVLGGAVQGVVMVLRDIGELKQLEQARIGFISIASHQLRTPLTSMRWFAEMLIGGDAGVMTPDQKHFVERIYEGTDRMIGLVNLLLQIARVEAGRIKVEPKPIDFKNTIRGLTVALKSFLEAKTQTIDVQTTPDPFPLIPMDQEVIWQVLQNLLSNASRYAPVKSAIEIRIVSKDPVVEFSIRDHGIGIPKESQGRIFEKFFRADNALKLVPEGSGLGLSLVKSLVEGWGGKIWFESEEGKGTTFYFTIPLKGMEAKEGEVKLAT
ncbi:MAG: hypothetical protein RL141_1077 [Candidatus Parcubacteria bacterium]|jgi:PAS domain S-box-containing protein